MPFHLSQALLGHGCFRAYLHGRARVSTPYCLWCPDDVEDAEHTIFKCSRYEAERTALASSLSRGPTADDVLPILCGDNRIHCIENELLVQNIECEERRRKEFFLKIIDNILGDKEKDEQGDSRRTGERHLQPHEEREG